MISNGWIASSTSLLWWRQVPDWRQHGCNACRQGQSGSLLRPRFGRLSGLCPKDVQPAGFSLSTRSLWDSSLSLRSFCLASGRPDRGALGGGPPRPGETGRSSDLAASDPRRWASDPPCGDRRSPLVGIGRCCGENGALEAPGARTHLFLAIRWEQAEDRGGVVIVEATLCLVHRREIALRYSSTQGFGRLGDSCDACEGRNPRTV